MLLHNGKFEIINIVLDNYMDVCKSENVNVISISSTHKTDLCIHGVIFQGIQANGGDVY